MNIILAKKELAPNVYEMVVRSPFVAHKCEPGQFVIVQADDKSERIPLTIGDFDPVAGTITLVIQVLGYSTKHLCLDFKAGDNIENIAGPLGNPSKMGLFGKIVLVGGGIGVAPIHPIARKYKQLGNHVICIMGARSKEMLTWEKELTAASHELMVCTDDGSAGRKGFVTDALREVLEHEKVAMVVAIGPVPMMKAVADLTRKFGVKTIVSLNAIMIDGTGMCGGCRVLIDGESKFACCDGPEFDAHQVDFDNLMMRLGMYKEQESLEYGCGGQCKCLK